MFSVKIFWNEKIIKNDTNLSSTKFFHTNFELCCYLKVASKYISGCIFLNN